MAQTPYTDLSSQDILAAHISGLQHDINKIQQVLEMKTASINNHQLRPVGDQEDPSLRYRIYEGTIRNWLANPTPVIYRNGVPVNSSEYEISPAHGVVVFHEQQNANDAITANFTYITNGSAWKENVQQSLGNFGNIEQQVNENTAKLANNPGGVELFYPISGSHITHFRRDYNPYSSSTTYNVNSHIPAFNILVYGNTIDAFPFPVNRKMRFSRAGIQTGSSGSSAKLKIGIYKDNGNFRPGELLFESPEINISAASTWGYVDIDWELEAGFYWIARHDAVTTYYNGLENQSCIPIVSFNAESFLQNLSERPNPHTVYGGYRATNVSYGNMPTVYPESGALFARQYYISPWLVVA